jgi:hypothetical protein
MICIRLENGRNAQVFSASRPETRPHIPLLSDSEKIALNRALAFGLQLAVGAIALVGTVLALFAVTGAGLP